MEPSSSDPAITLAPSSPGTETHQDKSNSSDLIQIDREEGATGGENRLSEEKEESDHRIISEGGADKNEEDFEQNLDEHHHAPEKTDPTASASASTAPTPLVEVDWDLLTTGESAPLLEASTSSSSTHPVDVRSHNKGKEKEAYQMDGGHGGEVLVASPRPASPPLDVVAPTFRVRLDSRELASSDIVVEETSSPSTLSSMALLEAKRKQQRHTVTHLPRQGAPPALLCLYFSFILFIDLYLQINIYKYIFYMSEVRKFGGIRVSPQPSCCGRDVVARLCSPPRGSSGPKIILIHFFCRPPRQR